MAKRRLKAAEFSTKYKENLVKLLKFLIRGEKLLRISDLRFDRSRRARSEVIFSRCSVVVVTNLDGYFFGFSIRFRPSQIPQQVLPPTFKFNKALLAGGPGLIGLRNAQNFKGNFKGSNIS